MNNGQYLCGSCGNELEPDWQFCENCGSAVTLPSAPTYINPPPDPIRPPIRPQVKAQVVEKKSKKWLYIVLGIGCVGIICICLLVVVAVAYFYYPQL